jgi:hypothetical protein
MSPLCERTGNIICPCNPPFSILNKTRLNLHEITSQQEYYANPQIEASWGIMLVQSKQHKRVVIASGVGY